MAIPTVCDADVGLLAAPSFRVDIRWLLAIAGLGDALVYVLASAAVYTPAPEDEHARARSRFSAVIWLLGATLSMAASACVVRR